MTDRAVLFDLDGTLVDTAPDMAHALNRLRKAEGRPPLPGAQIRPYVSRGAAGLVGVGFADVADDGARERLRERFLSLYAERLCVESVLFEALAPVLARIERTAGVTWGVVTNKPAWLAEPLLAQLALAGRSACLVCGDTLARRKPHPDPLLHAAEQIGVGAEACVYVGDDRRDALAGRAAGMVTIAAAWGYIAPDEPIDDWGVDLIAATPAELDDWLIRRRWLDATHG